MATTDHDSGVESAPDGSSMGNAQGPRRTAKEEIWLDGDVLACACPDCGAPMSIRLWLKVADCWRCGASLELSEAQEQNALRLLREQEESRRQETRQAASAITPTMLRKPTLRPPPPPVESAPEPTPAASPTRQPETAPRGPSLETTSEARAEPLVAAPPAPAPKPPPLPPAPFAPPVPDRDRPVAAMPVPHGTRSRLRDLHEKGAARVFWHNLSENLPAWLISLVVHMVAILLLGLWVQRPSNDAAAITLSTAVGDEDLSGDIVDWEEPLDAFTFEDPGQFELDVPPEVTGLGEAEVELGGMAATVLEPVGLLPDYRDLIDSARPALRGGMFAERDPRLRAKILQREGGTEFTEAAVARGLAWMARHQNADGSWSLDAFHKAPGCDGTCDGQGRRSDAAGTALGLLPFLGAGQTHVDGDYQDVVRDGLEWLVEHQRADGDLRDHHGFGRMYAHGQAAIVLCEAYAMTGDRWLRGPAQKALDFIVQAQHSQGGWRYLPGQAGDTSVVGWQLMALQSGRMHYLHVPDKTFYQAGRFLNQVKRDRVGGLYAYQRGGTATPAMTAEALLCRLYLGWPVDHRGVTAGVDYLLTRLPDKHSPNIYCWYYATQVMHHVGGEAWPKWNVRMRTALLDMQETQGHAAGSWAPRGAFDALQGGRLYMTSLAICTLEVYYRHMPLNRAEAVGAFERLDGPEETE